MPVANNVPISVAANGQVLTRDDISSYLKSYSETIVAESEIQDILKQLRQQLADITRKSAPILPPEPQSPACEPYPRFPLFFIPILSISLFLSSSTLSERLLIGVVPIIVLFISYKWHSRGNARAMAEWNARKEAYENEVKRIKQLNSTIEQTDSPEVIEVKGKINVLEKALHSVQNAKEKFACQNILATEYQETIVPCILYHYFESGRATTLSEALNIYHTDLFRNQQLSEQRHQFESIRARQNSILLQQELNAMRLSQQIADAKDDIQTQIALEALFTQSQLNEIINRLSS